MPTVTYERRRPEETTLYNVVRENLATLYDAVDQGALAISLSDFVRRELDGYLDCGLLCRGFARLHCADCDESRLVAFACKGRGFCPSCMGRRMCSTAANLIECVMPRVALRQWVLTFPFAWRKRLGYDGELFGHLIRIFISTVMGFYAQSSRAKGEGQSGAVIAIQRTSSDLRLNPHLHMVCLDGAYEKERDLVIFHGLARLTTNDVGQVLERAVKRMMRFMRRRGLLEDDHADAAHAEAPDGMAELAASAASGTSPPAGPEFRRGRLTVKPSAMKFEKHLCASLDGFTLHAATRAGGLDDKAREALLKYILRPAVANERVVQGPEGLVRIALKRPFSDGTVAVDMDPLSLLTRLAASVPPPYFHTVRYAGVLAPASKLRSRIVPKPEDPSETSEDPKPKPKGCRYRPWAELLKRTFGSDVLVCPTCGGRMKLIALITDPKSTTRFLRSLGEPTEPPERLPARGPPFWKSAVLCRMSGDAA